MPSASDGGTGRDERPLIAHLIYRLDTGGLENGLVNLVNHAFSERYRHTIICIDRCTDFRKNIRRHDVACYALNKKPGIGLEAQLGLWRLLRRLRPDVLHSRNLAALECQAVALLAGVPARVHGEHGRDIGDLDGSNSKRALLRRVFRPFVQRYIALSQDLARYLVARVGVRQSDIVRICNGVDISHFRPAQGARTHLEPFARVPDDVLVIGTVGRMQAVKDQLTLTRAFVELVRGVPQLAPRLRLVMVGEGPLRAQCQQILDATGLAHLAWLPGERTDIAEVMRGLDVFVLPSLGEGISNTILEAMATGLPVVATIVGGNAELVQHGVNGLLVPANDPWAMAAALRDYAERPERAAEHGRAGRRLAEARFSLDTMVASYMAVYDGLLTQHGRAAAVPVRN